ncbi:MAG TPA: thiamine diphosphokinase [Candidatus Limnocylindrales bacterium]|nr:thiamine diphosphokinase [Candidatus Limnocylindrales bacterium]
MRPSAPPTRRAIVLADGAGPTRAALDDAWPGWDVGVAIVVAADGGARLAEPLGLAIDRWVGDGDSIEAGQLAALRAAGIPARLVPRDKDESDTELALLEAIAAGADDVTIIGALGGPRFDHSMANVGLLAHPALGGRPACLLDAASRVTLLRGPGHARLEGRPGDLVTLLAFGDAAEGVVTAGLRYPLSGETLEIGPPRGLSNVRLGSSAEVEVDGGSVLLIETPATLHP